MRRTENIAEIPVEEEQVIVQEIPEVVGPLNPVCESTEPEYNQSPSGSARCQSPEHYSRKTDGSRSRRPGAQP